MKYLTILQFVPLCCLGLQHTGQPSMQITGCLEKHCLIGRVLTMPETQVRFSHDWAVMLQNKQLCWSHGNLRQEEGLHDTQTPHHKEDFICKSSCRLINTVQIEIGFVSKITVEQINKRLHDLTKLQQWQKNSSCSAMSQLKMIKLYNDKEIYLNILN